MAKPSSAVTTPFVGGEIGVVEPLVGSMPSVQTKHSPLGTVKRVAGDRISVQLSERLLSLLDERAAREGRSRSDLIREAIDAYLDEEEQKRIRREIVEGYERAPETEEELAAAKREGRAAIREEPW